MFNWKKKKTNSVNEKENNSYNKRILDFKS